MDTYVENLLAPVSVDDPAGPDLGDSPEMFRIEELTKGVPEDMFKGTPAEPPDWRRLRKECEGFLAKSKNLKVAVALSCCLLKQKGIEGFRDGLKVVVGMTREYWDAVHPRLDPEDGNDPTGRLNILGTLKSPRGMKSDWMLVMNHLYETPFAGGPGQEINLEVVEASRKQGGPGGGLDQAGVDSVIRATPMEQLTATAQLLTEIRETVDALDSFLTEKVGRQTAESFGLLAETITRIQDILAPFLQPAPETPQDGEAAAGDAPAGEAAPEDGSEQAAGRAQESGGGFGALRSRDDVLRQLDQIADFLARTEPSSPVPFILRRARKMVTMDFIQLMAELAIATDLKPAMGSGLPAETPPAE